MRIGEALLLDYTKDIDLEKGIVIIRRTQTKDTKGKSFLFYERNLTFLKNT